MKKKEKKDVDKVNESSDQLKKRTKRKKNKSTVLVIVLSIVFALIGIFFALLGTKVISFEQGKQAPVLYLLSEKVKVGDYVAYDSGTWEEDKIIPNSSTQFTFGGYTKDSNRSDGVSCDYDMDSPGWRVFRIEDGVVTLIQAGLSMCYYHGYGANTNDRSVKILSGQDENMQFDYFIDERFADSATVLSKEEIDKFYEEDSSYKKITNDLIRVGAPYWLASKSGSYYMWYVTEGGTVATDHVGMYGVRMIVTLKQDVKTEGQNDKKEWILNEDVKKDE